MNTNTFFNTWDSFLNDYHLYYRELSINGKMRFVKRVNSVFSNTQIIGKNGLEINEQIAILIAANLVQTTFGLKDFWLYGYDYIYVFPEAFYVEPKGEMVAGSTYNQKIISISWKDFAMDHLRAKDGKNVSFKQFGKALVRTVLNGKKYDHLFGSYLDEFIGIIDQESMLKEGIINLDKTESNELDKSEIVSKCMELFFERPEVFKQELPTSYAHFCLLMNQDPLNKALDYKLNIEQLNTEKLNPKLPLKIQSNYKYRTWHWLYNFSFLGFAICPMFIYFLKDNLLVGIDSIIFAMLSLAIVFSILFFSYVSSIGLYKNRLWFVLNNFFGIGPCFVTSYILLNSLTTLPFTYKMSRHSIASYYSNQGSNRYENTTTITFNYSDDFLIDFPRARTFGSFTKPPISNTLFNEAEYTLGKGILGLPLVIKRELY